MFLDTAREGAAGTAVGAIAVIGDLKELITYKGFQVPLPSLRHCF